MRRMEGRFALVTGAGSGIGRASAVALAAEGAGVALLDVHPAGLEETTETCRRAGGEALAIECDVGDPLAVAAAFAQARSAGRIDAVFNNAGVSVTGELRDTSDADWSRLLRVNLAGCFYVAREAARQMTADPVPRGAAIVNTASELALSGQPGYVAYTATKGGVLALTRALAAELAPSGIRVNAVCPGETDTPMLRDEFARALDPVAERRRHERSIPLGRLAAPPEIASAVIHLLSEESRYMTGATLVIDGGRTSCIGLGHPGACF